LATQTRLADQGREAEHQLDLSEATRSELESQIATLDSALADAKKEAKALTVKLSAARNADVKVPGSALKNKAASAAAGNADAVKVAQLKEDLYGDLTGLIVRGLQHDGDEDIFDCIQTGRNGSEFQPYLGYVWTVANLLSLQHCISNLHYLPLRKWTTTRMSSAHIGHSWTRTVTRL
jgi:hypothetical protein